jgi:hypothetical protein
MTAHFRNLLVTWVLLLVLLGAGFGASFLPLARSDRPLILIPVVLMVAAIGIMFMQVGRGPTIVRLFAVAALVWLSVLLGFGSLDPMTRTDHLVQAANPK